ncbi:MAG: NAD(P)H-dependent oxidoreductase [Moraxellaceae bacterium]|nr:MAG: NAD(P)H-dependent oxidoreductase [Moraxellaceae bacterium]
MANISIIVGSLRRDSINLKVARALIKLAAQEKLPHHLNLVDIGGLPLYNEDLWDGIPSTVTDFKNSIKTSDAVLFVTPEYNRSVPSPLKNALDWGSRPNKDNSWGTKPVAMLGASPGQLGTAVAQSHLRVILMTLNTRLMAQPEIYLKFEDGMIDNNNEIASERTRQYLLKFLNTFNEWINEIGTATP